MNLMRWGILTCMITLASAAAAHDRAGEVGRLVERSAQGPLRVGMAQADIMPTWPVFLPYGKSEPVTARYGDPCYAKAIVFQAGDLKVVFVELDIIGIRLDDADQIKSRIEKETGIGRDFIIVAATHNHAYPRVSDAREKEPGRIRDLLVERSSVAVKEAIGAMFPARIGVAKTTLRRDLVNNREKLMGPTLTDLYAVRIDDLGGNLRGVLFDFGAHPVVFTKSWGPDRAGEIGPDWPGYAASTIEDRWRRRMLFPGYNDGEKDLPQSIFTMFVLGAAGDQVGLGKGPTVDEKDGVRMPPHRVMTETVADNVLRLIENTTTTSGQMKMSFRAKVVGLSFKKDKDENPNWNRPPVTLIQALTLNDDTALLMIPGELTAELGICIRDHCGRKNCVLATQANDAIGYITSPEEALEGVTYAGKGAAFDHTRGRTIVEETVKLLNPAYTFGPLFDPATGFGRIAGHVSHPGDRRVVVGVLEKFEYPSTGGEPFWGKRVLADPSGNYEIDHLLPGLKFVYVREVDGPEALHEDRHERRTFFYARQVFVRGGETAGHIDFFIPKDFFATAVTGLALDESSVRVEGNTITGKVRIEGRAKENEPVCAAIYVYGIPSSDAGLMLSNPYLSVLLGRNGEFHFEGVPPGRYTVACWLDVNRNGYPEPGVDIVAGPSSKVLEVK